MNFCRCALHTFTDLSSEAVTSRWPSAEKLTPRTAAVCALNAVDSPLLKRHAGSCLRHARISDGEFTERNLGSHLHVGRPQSHRLVSWSGSHQFARWGEVHRRYGVLMSDEPERSGFGVEVPYHQSLVAGPRGWGGRKKMIIQLNRRVSNRLRVLHWICTKDPNQLIKLGGMVMIKTNTYTLGHCRHDQTLQLI